MPSVIRCPHCQKLLDAGAGGNVECPYCHGAFVAPKAGEPTLELESAQKHVPWSSLLPPPEIPSPDVCLLTADMVVPDESPQPRSRRKYSTVTAMATLGIMVALMVGWASMMFVVDPPRPLTQEEIEDQVAIRRLTEHFRRQYPWMSEWELHEEAEAMLARVKAQRPFVEFLDELTHGDWGSPATE